MKRKSFITILAVVLVAVLSLTSLVACDKDKDKHEFAGEWSYDAEGHWHVCTTEGHTDTDEKVAHTFDEGKITTPATEDSEGVKTFTCTACGYTKTEPVAKLAHTHNFDTTVWEKDETSHWHICTGNDCTEKQDVAEHTFDNGTITTAPTETAEGIKTFTCTVCGHTKTEPVAKLAHTHTFDTSVWEKDENSHWHPATCTHSSEKQDAASHTYGDWIVSKTATVTSEGEKYRTCSICGYNETAAIDKIPSYTITWKNADGTILETDTFVEEGTTPEYNGAEPTKAADEIGSYVFKGWTPAVTKATKDTTYTAEFTTTYKTYTIEFVMGNGTVAYGNCLYGTKITAPTDTAKKADNTYTYEFTGWDKEITNVTGDATYTAQYKATLIEYTVTFKDYNGIVLSTKTTYHYGDAVKVPADPTRNADNTYTYTFKNWGKAVATTCNGNAEYTATYTQSYIVYTVKFVDWKGTEIYTEKTAYNYDDTVTVPTAPTRNADKSCSSYTFAGWDKEVTKVKGDATYKATYTGTYINYTITFVDEDGTTVLSEKTDCHYGDKVVLPESPTKPSDENYSYPFTGWDKTVAETVEGNATYKATYGKNAIEHLYTVTFLDYDGTEISSKSDYHVGDTVTVPDDPAREADNIYTYTFDGWDKTVSTTCSGDATYKATYKEAYINYTVQFVDWDDTLILEKTDYHYGDTVTKPATTPTRAEDKTNIYVFKGWDKEVATVAGNTTYKAEYTATAIDYKKEYTITFLNDDETTVVATKTYHYNDTIDASDITTPTKESSVQYNYTFSGWSPEFAIVKGDATYTAQYSSEPREYTITFVDDSDETHVYFTKTYKYGETPTVTPEEIPTRESTEGYYYEFTRWYPATFETVTGNATYRAVFKAYKKTFTVTFDAQNGSEIITETYEYGDYIDYKLPTREADNVYTYTLSDWVDEDQVGLKDNRRCFGNRNFTAVWRGILIEYTVTFVNYDDSEKPKIYHYGDAVTVPVFTKPSDETYNYIFDGWDKEVSPTCNGNATYTAKYKEDYINYTIKFVNDDGTTVIDEQTYHYGDTVTVPANPAKASDNTYTYTFAGWDKTVVNCVCDATYKATYTANYIDYTVTFDQNGGTGGTESATVNYGKNMPTATAPTKSASEFKGYYDEDGVKYYDSQMNSVRTFDKTETLVLTAKWEIVWAYTDETKTSIYFGFYPQTKVTDETLISSLNALAGEKPTSDSLGKWSSYRYYLNYVESDYMFYIDIDCDNDGSYDYRGVCITALRPELNTRTGVSTYDSYQYANGYTGFRTRETYWFKYEPIKWNILTEADGYATVLADLAIDSQNFDYEANNVYSSNYAESTIRAWLNDTFYNTAFTAMQKELIQTVTVDNGDEGYWNSTEVTATPCDDTEDKIWLLSYQEAMEIDYSKRKKQSSDYAKCQGINANVYNETYNGYSSWWLRSPQDDDRYALSITEGGSASGNIPKAENVDATYIGVVPALKIKLS